MNRYLKKEYSSEYLFGLAYPVRLYIVEVNYSGKDIAISEIRCERGGEPKEKDNSRGFTENFSTYEAAEKRARRATNTTDASAHGSTTQPPRPRKFYHARRENARRI